MARKAKPDPVERKPPEIADVADRANVLSVFGPFNSMALIAMPVDLAQRIWTDGLAAAARPDMVAATERDIEAIRQRDPALADSSLAASALVMAHELIDPFNSATSKSMCAAKHMEAMKELRALAPPPKEEDALDRITGHLHVVSDGAPAA